MTTVPNTDAVPAAGGCGLAAVRYQTGFPIDDFLNAVTRRLSAEGLKLGGVVQHNTGAADSPCSTMTLVQLGSGQRFAISQRLGPESRACRLDPRGLAAADAPLKLVIESDIDLVILNKFGKAEAEGGGLRSTLARALELGVPILTAVRPPNAEAWHRFHGGLAEDLEADLETVCAWCHGSVRQRRAERAGAAGSMWSP
jgi:hypothetical protein